MNIDQMIEAAVHVNELQRFQNYYLINFYGDHIGWPMRVPAEYGDGYCSIRAESGEWARDDQRLQWHFNDAQGPHRAPSYPGLKAVTVVCRFNAVFAFQDDAITRDIDFPFYRIKGHSGLNAAFEDRANFGLVPVEGKKWFNIISLATFNGSPTFISCGPRNGPSVWAEPESWAKKGVSDLRWIAVPATE